MDPLSRGKYGNLEILPEMQILDAISNLQSEKISIQPHRAKIKWQNLKFLKVAKVTPRAKVTPIDGML